MSKRSERPDRSIKVPDLDGTDAMRLAAADDRFAKALMDRPEAFAKAFNLSPAELDALKTLPERADLSAAFDYDA